MGKNLLLHCWLALMPALTTAQTQKVDSLRNRLYQTTGSQEKLTLLLALCMERSSLNSDSLYAYATAAGKLARQQGSQSMEHYASYYLCFVLLKQSLPDSAIATCNREIEWLQANRGSSKLMNEFNFLKATALVRSSRYKEAINQYYQLLNRGEASGDTLMQVRANTGIGWVNMEINQNTEAMLWFQKALGITSNPQLLDQYAVLYANTASVYSNLGKQDSAIYFVNKALAVSRQKQDLTNLANSLFIQAYILIYTNKNKAAEVSMKEALEVRRRIGDPFYVVSDMAQISLLYASIAQYDKGIAIAQEGINIAQQYKLDAKLPMLYTSVAENLKAKGDYKGCSEIEEKLLLLKDSLYEKNSAEALARLQTKYDVQRKENTIIHNNLEIVRKNYLLYGLIALFVFLLTLALVLVSNYRRQQKITMDKMLKEQHQKETIAILMAEEKERKRIAADLHDNLGAYAAAISANVKQFKDESRYSPKLTRRIEENVEEMVSQLSNTIWVLKKESQRLTEISDRFKVWMQKIMQSYSDIAYDIEEQVADDMPLAPAHALHLFYILQEAVNNALKHSRCTHIFIVIASTAARFTVSVADDGQGFDPQQSKPGNGITNIRQRAALCGWQVSWQPGSKGGTSVVVKNG